MNDLIKNNTPNKITKSLLFLSSWILLVFLSKKLLSSPADNLDFLLKNILTLIITSFMTGLIIHFLPGQLIKYSIICILILAIAFAII